jgi:hypothetical protein
MVLVKNYAFCQRDIEIFELADSEAFDFGKLILISKFEDSSPFG